jgi:Pyruvate/2-oxoacid:ferredoxin oxidoreductase gamma subunit
MVSRVSTYQKDLVEVLKSAIAFDGFSLVDIWGICPGRYTRRNKLMPNEIAANLYQLPDLTHFKSQNARMEYGKAYRQEAAKRSNPKEPMRIKATCVAPQRGRQEVVILGSAGQRIITAGELLCLAGASAGCHATQKSDYPITVMKGHSVSEVILADSEIEYTGIEAPSVVIALAPEGVNRRKQMLVALTPECILIKAAGVGLPTCEANIIEIDFKAHKIKSPDWALAALAVLADRGQALTKGMLTTALKLRFNPQVFQLALAVTGKVTA